MSESTSFRGYWAMQDANYNVLGLVDDTGALVERYEYTPYGQRTVYFSPGTNDPKAMAPTNMSRRVELSGSSGVWQPYGLSEFGHQGLMHDEETGLVYNRARMRSPRLGRWMQREPLGYIDGMSLYQHLRSRPSFYVDWNGNETVPIDNTRDGSNSNLDRPFDLPGKDVLDVTKDISQGMAEGQGPSIAVGNAAVVAAATYPYSVYQNVGQQQGIKLAKSVSICRALQVADNSGQLPNARTFYVEYNGTRYAVIIMDRRGTCHYTATPIINGNPQPGTLPIAGVIQGSCPADGAGRLPCNKCRLK